MRTPIVSPQVDSAQTPQLTERHRIVLYSHDTMGLGHTRRNLLIAQTLANASAPADVLLVTGAHESNAFAMPDAVDCLSLPALRKGEDGRYQARRLGLSLDDLTTFRAETIRAAILAFDPDVLIVDNVPRGAARELDPTFAALRVSGRAKIVLGLRDVLDEPSVVAQEWRRSDNIAALREIYDAIWIYGDPRVFDPVQEYAFPPDVAGKVTYTGYLDCRQRHGFSESESDATLAQLCLPPGRLALCLVGGGQDGSRVASAAAEASAPPDMNVVIVTGPYIPEPTRQRLRAATDANSRLRVIDFLPEPTLLLNHAERVIAMGGYNTVCEILAFEKRALIVPRVTPRQEQWIRAERMGQIGLLDVLHPGEVTPDAVSQWLAADLGTALQIRGQVDLGGLDRIPALLDAVLDTQMVAWAGDLRMGDAYVHVA